jgi:hypothetical protein
MEPRTYVPVLVMIMTAIKSQEPDLDQSSEGAIESEIGEFVRRDVAPRQSPDGESGGAHDNITTLLQRVGGASVQEIDRLIADLQALRQLLHSEGVRVQREIIEYAQLSQSAMHSTRIINESLAKWKGESATRARR